MSDVHARVDGALPLILRYIGFDRQQLTVIEPLATPAQALWDQGSGICKWR